MISMWRKAEIIIKDVRSIFFVHTSNSAIFLKIVFLNAFQSFVFNYAAESC